MNEIECEMKIAEASEKAYQKGVRSGYRKGYDTATETWTMAGIGMVIFATCLIADQNPNSNNIFLGIGYAISVVCIVLSMIKMMYRRC